MKTIPAPLLRPPRAILYYRSIRNASSTPPIIKIENGTFYSCYPIPDSPKKIPPLYPNLNFTLPSSVPSMNDGDQRKLQHWAVIGSSSKAKFLEILQGRHISIPPTARSYPYLATNEIAAKDTRLRFPGYAIKYIGFDGEGKQSSGGIRGLYLSARYESRREDTDFTVLQYLKGQTSLNPLENESDTTPSGGELMDLIIANLHLRELVNMPLANLSNGQMRRARIAKALVGRPEVLLLDEPFLGLDPPTVQTLSLLLHNLAAKSSPRLVVALRPQDPIPDWITHLVILGPSHTVALQGEREAVFKELDIWKSVSLREVIPNVFHKKRQKQQLEIENAYHRDLQPSTVEPKVPASSNPIPPQQIKLHPRKQDEDRQYRALTVSDQRKYDHAEELRERGLLDVSINILRDMGLLSKKQRTPSKALSKYGEPIVTMEGVSVKYGDKIVLGDWKQKVNGEKKEGLFWEVCRGQRWGLFGLNGSGKTTLISLITSDHPQTYALPIKLFGRSRLPEPGQPGISVFDLQSRIGHSSPEIHAFFPRNLSVRASIESAWADTFLSKPKLDHGRDLDVDSVLYFFEADLRSDFLPGTEQKGLYGPEAFYGPYLDSLDWADNTEFSSLTTPQQRLVLFLRAVVHKPELVILDEAFAGMPRSLRDKCLHFLEVGEQLKPSTGSRRISHFGIWQLPPRESSQLRHKGLSNDQALIVISHVKEEVPDIVSHWMRLPAAPVMPGQPASRKLPPRFGTLSVTQTVAKSGWKDIWAS